MNSPVELHRTNTLLKGRRILVVEDQSLIAMEMQERLENAGAVVVGPVGRIQRGLSSAEKEPLDAALLDVDLNGERCWPIADALVSRSIPFAFTTGFAANIVMPDRFVKHPVITKPCSERDVLAILEELLARPET
jgi:CheY-like chemotaxis protein